ncbi:MAG: AAA domain-containing protein [Gemmatimonadetes bacterium]|nr:AAA domain-containing protein [Gemmatimonadota bacterium]MYC00019.1 AAA domain-containing protein [Gemmatimonadota bacterium]MYI47377.1 AAA domain-containing protein [Gemmatimonadota bacterium]
MDDSLDLQTTYRAILNAAREGKYVTYGTLVKANGARWQKARYKLNDHLGELMTLATQRDWPIPTAIVVDKGNLETGTLSDSAMKGFVGAARALGRDVQDPQAFIEKQQKAMFAWAEGAPDELGLSGDKKPSLDHPLNTILYGPPGTGKTYATFRRCVEICDSTVGGKTPEAIHERYRKLVEEGRVEFVTFHQSYGYEEFVEGLRPETEGDGGGFRLTVRDGVLKRIAKRARQTPEIDVKGRQFYKASLGSVHGQIFRECMEHGCVRFDWLNEQDWSDPRYDKSDFLFAGAKGLVPDVTWRSLKMISAYQFRCQMKQGDIVVVPEGASKYRAVGEVVGNYEYDPSGSPPRWAHRRAVRWHWKAEDQGRPVTEFKHHPFAPHRVYTLGPHSPEVLLQHLQQDPPRQPYVLVIDEINRANIARVLGELITLLEEDKREGAENELAVTLPHSNECFTLPPNLHVLGTMNTADRSIALLDTALRRRFVFEEITPEPALLAKAGKSAGVNLPAVLSAMNGRLEWLVGRDHLIGHAWFLKANSREAVDEVMRRKVIPLIAEYFYDEWEKVRAVLGGTDAFVQGEVLEPPPDLDGGTEKRNRWTVREPFPEGAYEELIAGGTS